MELVKGSCRGLLRLFEICLEGQKSLEKSPGSWEYDSS
jgi:hypothetical protein